MDYDYLTLLEVVDPPLEGLEDRGLVQPMHYQHNVDQRRIVSQTYDFCNFSITPRAYQTMIILPPFIFAMMTEYHLSLPRGIKVFPVIPGSRKTSGSVMIIHVSLSCLVCCEGSKSKT